MLPVPSFFRERREVDRREMEAAAALRLRRPAGSDDATDPLKCPAPAAAGSGGASGAATKVQKVYRSYRTRRRLADSAVVVEELWWQALDFARLNYNTISFFDEPKPKTAALHWKRISQNALKVGHGLSREAKALKLAFEHWIEAIDSRHRSGHNLHFYYNLWCQSQSGQPFFYWLDVGDGKDVDLPECPRTLLKKQCIRYLGPKERELYEYIINEGKIIHKKSREPLDTSQGPNEAYWIFVMSTTKRLYAGKKEKGVFQHSSFLAGGATIAAGKFTVKTGVIKSIWSYSGHYKPSTKDLSSFLNFLEENGVNLKEIEMRPFSKGDHHNDSMPNETQNIVVDANPPQVLLPPDRKDGDEGRDAPTEEAKLTYRRTLSGGLHSPKGTDVPQQTILERIKSKSETESYQLGLKLSLKWSTGLGPRIGCVKDYPSELRVQALEMVDLLAGASSTTSQTSLLTQAPQGCHDSASRPFVGKCCIVHWDWCCVPEGFLGSSLEFSIWKPSVCMVHEQKRSQHQGDDEIKCS